MLPQVSNKQAYGAMLSRGKQASSGGGDKILSRGGGSKGGRASRGPGVSSLNNRIPPIGNNNSSVAGAGFNSKSPYNSSGIGSSGKGGGMGKASGSNLNTNVFNIPKYGAGGLGGGIGGGIGSYGSGSLGGGIGAISAARLRSRERDAGS